MWIWELAVVRPNRSFVPVRWLLVDLLFQKTPPATRKNTAEKKKQTCLFRLTLYIDSILQQH